MTVESVAYTPRRILEQLKGISEQKAQKILGEGALYIRERRRHDC
jgi:DNA repair protein RAD51